MKAFLVLFALALFNMVAGQGVNVVDNNNPGHVNVVNNRPGGGFQRPDISPAFIDPNIQVEGANYPGNVHVVDNTQPGAGGVNVVDNSNPGYVHVVDNNPGGSNPYLRGGKN